MKLTISKTLFQKITTSSLSLAIFYPTLVAKAYSFKEDSGLDLSAKSSGFKVDSPVTITDIIGNALLVFLSFLGVIFFAYIIYGGIVWMTADGNETKVKKANDIVMNSLYGLIITMSAFVISWLVINNIVK